MNTRNAGDEDKRVIRLRHRAERAITIIAAVTGSVAEGRAADEALRETFRHHKEYGSRDRRFYADTVFSAFRWKGWTEKVCALPQTIALACLLDADETTPALDALCDVSGFDGERKPCGTLSLEEKQSWLETLSTDADLTPLDLVPPDILSHLHLPGNTDPEIHQRDFLAAAQSRPPTWLRVASASKQRLLDHLNARGMVHEISDALPYAVALSSRFSESELRAQAKAHFQIQDLSSQCVGQICAPAPGQKWWDVCAGAGGKALHLAAMMENRGHILATDVRRDVLNTLRKRSSEAGVHCISARHAPGVQAHERRDFDGVLVDAPCTGLGTWHRNPDARWRFDPQLIQRGAERQLSLLERSASAVVPGGKLIYAVCTVTEEETHGVIAQFLDRHPEFRLVPAAHPLTGDTGDGCIWIWPWQGPCNGMFIASMSRVA